MRIFDISVAVSGRITSWPGSPLPRFTKTLSLKNGDEANNTKLTMSVHTGTHIDAPSHFISGGQTIDQLPIDIFFGRVFVAYLPKVKEITAQDLENLNLPKGTVRLLFRTSNSLLWEKGISRFRKKYVGLNAGAARWLVKRRIKLVGVDYLSVAKFDEAVLAHQILLKAGMALLEGINLSKVKPGFYQLICLPVKIFNCEAAPTRAILIEK